MSAHDNYNTGHIHDKILDNFVSVLFAQTSVKQVNIWIVIGWEAHKMQLIPTETLQLCVWKIYLKCIWSNSNVSGFNRMKKRQREILYLPHLGCYLYLKPPFCLVHFCPEGLWIFCCVVFPLSNLALIWQIFSSGPQYYNLFCKSSTLFWFSLSPFCNTCAIFWALYFSVHSLKDQVPPDKTRFSFVKP